MSEQWVVLVLGAHRSGTSAVTRLINLAGYDVGDDLIKPSQDNPKGFWEHSAIVALNNELMANFGISWESVLPILDQPAPPWFFERADEIWTQVFAEKSHVCVKDPRMTRLLPWWLSFFETRNVQLRIVVVARHPFEIADSLGHRNGLSREQGCMLFLRYTIECMDAIKGHRSAIVTFDDVIKTPYTSLSKLGRKLSLKWPSPLAKIRTQIEASVDPDLRHHQAHVSARDLSPTQAWAVDVHRLLSAKDQRHSLWSAHIERLRTIDGWQVLDEPLIQTLQAQNQSLKSFINRMLRDKDELDEFAARKDREISEFKRQETELRAELDRLNQEIEKYVNQNDHIAPNQSDLGDRVLDLEVQVIAANQLVESERERVAHLNRELEQKDQDVALLNRQLEARETDLSQLRKEFFASRESGRAFQQELAEVRELADRLAEERERVVGNLQDAKAECERLRRNLEEIVESKSFRLLNQFVKYKLE